MTRRSAKPETKDFQFGENGDKAFDFNTMELKVRDQILNLTMMEASVLRYLIEHEGKPVSRKAMLEERMGRSGEHRYPPDRQLHRAAPTLYRGRPHQAAPSANRPGHGLSLYCGPF